MLYKGIGAILIVLSCSGCGFAMAAGKRREERLLCQLLDVLRFMESELRYRLTELPELCRLAAEVSRGSLGRVFSNLSRELERQKLPDAGSCMYAAIGRSGELPGLIRRPLVQLGHSLGRFDLEGQLLGLGAVEKSCEQALEGIRRNRELRLRSYHTLGICAGLALAILLL